MPKKDKPLEEMKVWELEKLYYLIKLKEMGFKVHEDFFFDEDFITDSEGFVKVDPRLRLTTTVDPETRSPTKWAMDYTEETATAADATLTLPLSPSGALYEVHTIIASGVMDATVVNRTWLVAIEDILPVAAATAARSCETSVVTSSASQHIQMVLPPRPYHFTNDHGTIAIVADENPLPLVLRAGASIIFENSAANWGVGDSLGIGAKYRRVA